MIKFNNFLNNNYFFVSAIIISSFFFTYYSGLRGIFPIDSFLIFDGGVKILNGIYPFKDYWTISGPILDLLQSIIFDIFNVSWLSYILHAALVNTFLSLLSYYFFISFGLKKVSSFTYSIGISILAYPSVGSPFMDHHATIFSLSSMIILILAFKKNTNLYWFLSPLLLGVSFFSKQIPSAFLILLFLFLIFFYLKINKFKNLSNLVYFIFGLIFFFLALSTLVFIYNIPPNNILTQYFLYPLGIGDMRTNSLNLDFKNLILQFKFIYISLIPLFVAGFSLIIIKKKTLQNKIDILIFFAVAASTLIFIFTQLITKNQILIFFLIPFVLAISHYFTISNHTNKFIKKYKKIIKYILILILITTVFKYHVRFNVEKKFMELSDVNINVGVPGDTLDSSLKGLMWVTPQFANNPNLEISLLKDVKDKIILDKRRKIILSDYQILPHLTKTKQFAPNKWFDNLSVPDKKNDYFDVYKNFFKKKLEEQRIEVIYIVGDKKKQYIENIFVNPSCYSENKINQITKEIYIKNCY